MVQLERDTRIHLFCPFKIGTTIQNPKCMGSECAAWRWVVEKVELSAMPPTFKTVVTDYGYCGMAGKPEHKK